LGDETKPEAALGFYIFQL